MAMVSSVVAMGLWMKSAEKFMSWYSARARL
jgi:hypothetical protein